MYTPPVNIFRNISRNMVSLAEAGLFKMAEGYAIDLDSIDRLFLFFQIFKK